MLILKINITSRRIAYFYYYDTKLKIIRGLVCDDIRTIWDYFSKLQHTEIYSSFFKFMSPFMNHVKFKRNSRLTPRKRDLSSYHAMHQFHAITPIILLFHESRPEKERTVEGASFGVIFKGNVQPLFLCNP